MYTPLPPTHAAIASRILLRTPLLPTHTSSLLRTLLGSYCACHEWPSSLVLTATCHLALFTFSELLSLPTLSKLTGTRYATSVNVLHLFAYGTLKDYRKLFSSTKIVLICQSIKDHFENFLEESVSSVWVALLDLGRMNGRRFSSEAAELVGDRGGLRTGLTCAL
ncbi:hypothetical protein GUJ93_ZPchr0002g26308 [Zizania palustris]|uniref:Uncharacterized protein n=1 Tax=Zizania palustris TaxID=103762 RepID=A0A8J5VBJ2_ZIZPA|nr:hypothetical protein GUJ93_ZPchr0002g26308 [Zizania palustris]